MRGARSVRALLAGLALVLLAGRPAPAAEWGTIVAGTSTKDSVRSQYGAPTRTSTPKVEGYDTTEWIYEGEQAPGGIRRMTVEFGLLTPRGYRADLVRMFALEPVPGVFTQKTVVLGWGTADRVGKEGDTPVLFYNSGLLVLFDSEGWVVQRMLFTPPQPHPE